MERLHAYSRERALAEWAKKRQEGGFTRLRERYPPATRDSLPPGVSAGEFIRKALADLQSHQGTPASEAQVARRVEVEDLLAATIAGVPDALRELIDLARSGHGKERDFALILLGRVPNPEALEVLLDRLTAPDPSTRVAAIRSLAQDQGWNHRPDLDPDFNVTEPGGGRIANPRTADALVRALSAERDRRVIAALVSVLAEQLADGPMAAGDDERADAEAHPDGMHFAERTTAAFRALFLGSEDPESRSHVLTALARSNSAEAVRILSLAAAEARTADERAGAIGALGSSRAQSPSVLASITRALDDADEGVRSAAVQACWRAGRDEAVLERLLSVHRRDPNWLVARGAFVQAVENLMSDRNALGEVVPADHGRALAWIEEAVARDDYWAYKFYVEPLVRRLRGRIRAHQFVPSADEQARVDALLQRTGMK